MGLFDELLKIAEEKKDSSFKSVVKNVALASLGSAAGTGVAMLGHKVLKSALGERYERAMPATRLKYIAPAIGIGSTALVGLTLALQRELAKPEEKAKNG